MNYKTAKDKLESFGYLFQVVEGKPRLTYSREGDPPEEARDLIAIIRENKDKVLGEIAWELIKKTFQSVNQFWIYGSLTEVDKEKMLRLEEEISKAALEGNMSVLEVKLNEYQQLMREAVKRFQKKHVRKEELLQIRKEIEELLPLVS